MGASWKLEESRLVQFAGNGSAANADIVNITNPVPDGKIWVIVGCGYYPSVAETQVVSFRKSCTKSGLYVALLNPVSLALNPAYATFIEQGMEYMLLPGEVIQVLRGTHTAGSSMNAWQQFIEIDQPLYTYEDPQTVKRQARALSSIRTALGGSVGRGSGGGAVGRGGRGGGSSSIPI